VLNPDTLLEADAITQLITALAGDRSLAAVSPKICRWDFVSQQKTKIIDSCGLVLKAGLHFADLGQGAEDTGQFDERSIIGPSGAVGLFRLSALEKVKEPGAGQDVVSQYFDEHFFIYKEDCDLAYRLQAAGLKSRLVPTAIAYHDRTVASSGHGLWRDLTNRGQKSRLVRAWSFRNQHFLFVKHWKKQNFVNKIIVIFRFLSMFVFSLILEQFLLKQYAYILHPNKVLTNVK
jgi:GT2 family glycosyltransferase